MKQSCFRKNIFFAPIILLALLFSAGSFLNSFPANAEIKKSVEKNYIESEIVAKISPDADASAIGAKYNLDADLLKTSLDGNLYILTSQKNISTKKLIKLLQKDPQVISVQPNFKYRALGKVANDSLFPQEWTLADVANVAGGVSASSAWDFETRNKNKIPIAIIDTGVNLNQPELKGMITSGRAKGRNISSPKKKPQDLDGHGTFLAGIIAAKTNNKKGIAGSSFFGNLKIMPLKFDFTTDEAISAISHAKSLHIPIINASWGSYGEDGYDPFLKDAIESYPGIFVTASGNGNPETGVGFDHDSGDSSQKMYPCDFDLPNILCVGASGKDGRLTEYSDYGAFSVDVVAPGGTDGDPIVGLDLKKNKYTFAEGSSVSTAFATAEAGLILSKKPSLSASQIIEIIKNSVDAEPSLSGKVLTGGKINFQKAMELSVSY